MGEQRTAGVLLGGRAPQWRDDSGKSSIRAFIALFMIISMVYVGMKLIPVRAGALQFADAITDEVVYAGGRRRSTDTQMEDSLLEAAQIIGLPITRDDITIQRRGTEYLVIEANYTVVIEFIGGYTFDWSFSPRSEGPLF